MILSLVLHLFFFAGAQAQAVDVTELRLDNPGGSMEHVPTRNQSSLNSCFAYTAAQLIDAWRFSHGDTDYTFQTSALPIAAVTNQKAGDFEFDKGGNVAKSVALARVNGICRQSESLDSFDTDTMDSAVSLLKRWRYASWYYLYSEHKSRSGYDDYMKNPEQGLDVIANLEPIIESRAETPVLPEIDYLKEIFLKVNPSKQFQAIFNDICLDGNKHALQIPKEISVDVSILSAKSISQKILRQLGQANPQPIAISYCANVIADSEYVGMLESGAIKDGCKAHASLVIGTRNVNSRAQFLVRNSWGDNCGSNTLWPCDGKGNYWIDGGTLAINIWNLVYIPQSKSK